MLTQNKILKYPLLCCSCFLLFSGFSQSTRHALLVGVGNYPKESKWDILSANNDVALIKNTLIRQGFKETAIFTLTDKAATKSGILETIKVELTSKVAAGDVAIFHFSGHGQQVWDQNMDEIDGLDEALVPYGSPKYFAEGINEGAGLLRDDELGEALLEVRRKLGVSGHLLVLIDACHSGTSSRGLRVARGTDIVMADSLYLCQLQENKADRNSLIMEMAKEAEGLAPMVSLFSSSPHQLSYEYQGDTETHYGLFSHAFSQAMENLPTDATYLMLLDKIKLEISAVTHQQTPQSEGELNQLVLKNGLRPSQPYFSVLDVIHPKLLVINAGELQGFSENSKVALYPIGTIDTTGISPLALGIVEEATAFDADILLDHPLNATQELSANVFLQERHYGELSVKVQLDISNKELEAEIATALATHPFIELVNRTPDLYLESSAGLANVSNLVLYQNDDTQLWKASIELDQNGEAIAAHLLHPITQYVKANYLRNLETPDTKLKAKIQLLIKNEHGEFVHTDSRSFKVEDIIKVQINNEGNAGFYFTFLDIQPDHQINNIFPGIEPAADFYLPAGKSYISPFEIEIEAPLGTEVLKIIATNTPLKTDLTRGSNNPLEVLLSTLLQKEPTTRGGTPALPSEVGFIGSVVLEIEE